MNPVPRPSPSSNHERTFTRSRTIWGAVIVAAVMLLFPPWKFTLATTQIERSGPYAFVGNPPPIPVTPRQVYVEGRLEGSTYVQGGNRQDQSYFEDRPRSSWSSKIDTGRLVTPLAVLALITLGLLVTLPKNDGRSAPSN